MEKLNTKANISPQELERLWIPRRQKFVTAIAGWCVQKKHILLRRLIFLGMVCGGMLAGLTVKVFLSERLPYWTGWMALAVSIVAALWSGMVAPEQRKSQLILVLMALVLGNYSGIFLSSSYPKTAFWILAFVPPLGSTINVLLYRKPLVAEKQFLLLGPWLVASLIVAYTICSSSWQIAAGGITGLIISYLLIRTEQASLCVRGPAEVFVSSTDALAYMVRFFLGPLRGE